MAGRKISTPLQSLLGLQNLTPAYTLASLVPALLISSTQGTPSTCALDYPGSLGQVLLILSISDWSQPPLSWSLSARGSSPAPTTAGPPVCYNSRYAGVHYCFQVFLPTSLLLPDSRDHVVPSLHFRDLTVSLHILFARRNLLLSIFCWLHFYKTDLSGNYMN